MEPYDLSFFTGTTGSGKSYATKVVAKKYRRLIVWDSGKEYWVPSDSKRRLTKQAEGNFNGTRGMGNILVKSPDHLATLMLRSLRRSQVYNNHRFIIRPVDISDVEYFEKFMVVIRDFIDEWGLGWYLVIEEISDITSPTFTPKVLKSLVRRHRHNELGIAFITQRPAGTSTWIKSQAKHIFVFQLTLVNDLKAVNDWIGQFTDTEGKKVMRVPISPVFLKKRNFILMNVRNIKQIYILDGIRTLIPTGKIEDVPQQAITDPEVRTNKLSESVRKLKEMFRNDN